MQWLDLVDLSMFWIETFFSKQIIRNLRDDMELETVVELEQWLEDNCYSRNNYSINGSFIYEGYGLENNGGLYQWYYTEHGEKTTLEHFATEKEAVKFALAHIKADKYANRNFIGMYKETAEIEKIIKELEKREVEYYTDVIPYGGFNDMRTRIYVIGCGIKKVSDLKNCV